MVSKLIVEAAVQTAKMPNQSCLFTFGEAASDMVLRSKDYKEMVSFLTKNTNKEF